MQEQQGFTRRTFLKEAMALGASALIVPFSSNSIFSMPAYAVGLTGAVMAPKFQYRAHVADMGWLDSVGDGKTAGTTGQNRNMEALLVSLEYGGNKCVSTRAHVANKGWLSWVESGKVAGTVGQGRRLEAIQSKLIGKAAEEYDLYYRVHVRDRGWLGWAKNGASAGSEELAVAAQAVQMRLVKKGSKFDCGKTAFLTLPAMTARGHLAYLGWRNYSGKGIVGGKSMSIGTTGQSRNLEAVVLNLTDFDGKSGIKIRAHVKNIGWQNWVSSGKSAGTTGKGLPIEAVQIRIDGSLVPFFDVYYRAHLKNVGWLGYAKNGETAGSTGQDIPAEAIEVVVVRKGHPFNRGGKATYVKPKQSAYDQKVNAFLADARWRSGTRWTASQRPKLSSYSAKGCCAYAVDFCKYVFGANSYRSGKAFYNPSAITAGDVIKVVNSQHWFVVLSRNGNSLRVAEGNWDSSKVVVSNGAYTVRGNVLYRNGKKFRTFSVGYHMR